MDKITTTIRRQPLREIVAGDKTIEYREIKPYWIKRLSSVRTPFLLRLINGMQSRAPEVTLKVRRVRRNSRTGLFELHLGQIVSVRHWNRRRQEPAAT